MTHSVIYTPRWRVGGNVAYWHLALFVVDAITVAFGDKADIATWARNDAFDPSPHFGRLICCGAQQPNVQ
jgi:hypothetical protein